jgi:Rrf2 family protein
MSSILKISEAAAIALHTMVLLSANRGGLYSTRKIASILEVSEHHLAKVLQRLVRAGMIRSIRGPRGGFVMAKKADEILLLDIYEAIDGPLEPDNCLMIKPSCGGSHCLLGDLLVSVNNQVRSYLRNNRLSDLSKNIGDFDATA